MAVAPNPSEILQRAVDEGERRLDQSLIELLSTGFIAGLTILFGILANGIVRAILEPESPAFAELAGALAFAIGFVFLFVGRAELFTENFFDPVATVVERREPGMLKLVRLWSITLVLNFVGGIIFALIVSVDGVLRAEAGDVLSRLAEQVATRGAWATFVTAVAGGTLVTLISFLVNAVNSVGGRMAVAYFGGFLLALGPFDHVVVSGLEAFLGILFGATLGFRDVAAMAVVLAVGNLIGGLGLITLTHITQAKGGEASAG